MKKAFLLLFAVVFIVLSLVSCADSADSHVNLDALVTGLTETYSMKDGSIFTSTSDKIGHYLDEDLIASYYGDAAEVPDFSKVDSYCVYIDDTNPKALIDVGVFKMSDLNYSDTLIQYLKARIDDKIAAANSYPDIDVDMLKKAVIRKSGVYVYYTVCYDSEAIAAKLAETLG